MKRKWFDKKVLILGLSKSGVAAARYLSKHGADCYISENKPFNEKDAELIEQLKKEDIKVETGLHSDDFIDNSYIAITSPGIPPKSEIFKRLRTCIKRTPFKKQFIWPICCNTRCSLCAYFEFARSGK